MSVATLGAVLMGGCAQKSEKEDNFKYLIDEFADLQVNRYRIPGWEDLSLQQKEYAYHLGEAAKWGRDIIWDQNCEVNLRVRHALEAILASKGGTSVSTDVTLNKEGDDAEGVAVKGGTSISTDVTLIQKGDDTESAAVGAEAENNADWDEFLTYAKRVFFSNGIHHHYAENKIFPGCGKEYFAQLMKDAGVYDEDLLDAIYNPARYPEHIYTGKGDIVKNSAANFYEGVTKAEVDAYYAALTDPSDPTPVSLGLNTKVVKGADGVIREIPWKVGGLYGEALEKICEHLEKAAQVAENDAQKQYIATLVEYYRTADLKLWDKYNVEWVQENEGTVDFVNGFVEDYDDPLGRKASWEGIVNIKDEAASARTKTMSDNAQWFEDNAPMDPRFKKKEVKGVTAKVINVTVIAGDDYPATAIGINLPNANWIRRDYGSKSVTISNITDAYDFAAQERPRSLLTEFAWDEAEIERARKWGSITSNVHTDLHECLGHGSGQLLPGVADGALKEYSSALEESRADIFGLYYMADPKLVELGILPDKEAYKAAYDNFIRNGIMTQFCRVELGRPNTEAHMQDRKLIAQWCYEKGLENNVIEKKVRDGKTYFVINDYEALRGLFGELLGELQRIKSEGDYAAGKALVEKYAVQIDPVLHKEVLERYATLGLKPYGGFINPDIVPVEKGGKVIDYKVVYTDDFLAQQLAYGRDYAIL